MSCPVRKQPESSHSESDFADSGSGCPVAPSERGGAGVGGSSTSSSTSSSYKHPHIYNVYGERIDGANIMPAQPQQNPWPGQKMPLSTERVVSTIPKGGTDGTWTYPSPQMFFNAIMRKGKSPASGVRESDMEAVVAIHNNTNERAWREVLEWESRHKSECANPTLLRFVGKDQDYSIKARIRGFFGLPLPFDRHDWIVDRCGKEVRYIIDFYSESSVPNSAFSRPPPLSDLSSPSPVFIDCRPAMGGVGEVIDRLVMFPSRAIFAAKRWANYFGGRKAPPAATPEQIVNQMRGNCLPFFHLLASCGRIPAENGRDACHDASTALNLCLARNCPPCVEDATAFYKATTTLAKLKIESSSSPSSSSSSSSSPSSSSSEKIKQLEIEEESSFLQMTECLKKFASIAQEFGNIAPPPPPPTTAK